MLKIFWMITVLFSSVVQAKEDWISCQSVSGNILQVDSLEGHFTKSRQQSFLSLNTPSVRFIIGDSEGSRRPLITESIFQATPQQTRVFKFGNASIDANFSVGLSKTGHMTFSIDDLEPQHFKCVRINQWHKAYWHMFKA